MDFYPKMEKKKEKIKILKGMKQNKIFQASYFQNTRNSFSELRDNSTFVISSMPTLKKTIKQDLRGKLKFLRISNLKLKILHNKMDHFGLTFTGILKKGFCS